MWTDWKIPAAAPFLWVWRHQHQRSCLPCVLCCLSSPLISTVQVMLLPFQRQQAQHLQVDAFLNCCKYQRTSSLEI